MDKPKYHDPSATVPAPSADDVAALGVTNLPPDDAASTVDQANMAGTIDQHPAQATTGFKLDPIDPTIEVCGAAPDDAASVRTLALPTRAPSAPRAVPTVPGYEIQGELGRGGMGVVYKARQLGLNRTVALKVVLAGAHASSDKLARFHTEALAVARVQHPNIVQIYEVGEHDGLPYFSLEFVDGGPLDRKIDRQPQKPREAAEIVAPLAQAMHFAHQRNIVHRDLKPANVLLTATGIPKITDFGLAKAVEADDSQTRSGTILGSPSYMSPEQARGDSHQVGPLSDQYGLGAILYELLTGRPPFMGSTVFETLEQVQSREPVPPTQLAPRVPMDLETICLKCLQKEPAKRYADCSRLADDLQSFLNGEPIRARPVSGPERLWRWCQRNPRIAALSTASLALLVTALVTASAFAVTYRNQNITIAKEKQTAETQTGIALVKEAEAVKERAIAVSAAAEERRQRDIADAARKAADESAQLSSAQATLALNTIQTLVSTVQQRLGESPGTQQLKKEVLQLAMRDLSRVADNIGKSTSKEATLLAVYSQLGKVFRQLGETDKSAEMIKKCVEIARERVILKEGSDAARGNLALSLRDLAEVTQEKGRDMQAAFKVYEEALAVRQGMLDHPKAGEGAAKRFLVMYELAEDQTRVATSIYRLGDPARALPHFQQALALRQELLNTAQDHPDLASFPPQQQQAIRAQIEQDVARSNLGIGEMAFRSRDTAGALLAYVAGLSVRQKLYDANPKNLGNRFELARTHGNFADIHLFTQQPEEAERRYRAALTHLEALAAIDRENAQYQRDLGLAWYRLGCFAERNGDTAQAAEHFAKARAVREAQAAKDLTNDRRQLELMLSLARSKEHERSAQLADRFRQSETADSELLLDVARAYAQCAAAAAEMPELSDQYAEKSLEAISAAVAQGYRDAVYLERETDFDPLRARAEFQELVKRAAQPAATRLVPVER